jgi:hypothetical protein
VRQGAERGRLLKDAIPFAIPGAKLGPHDKDGPAFLKLMREYKLRDPALDLMAKVVDLGVNYVRLAARDAGAFLRDIAAGRVIDARLSVASWSSQIVDPLLTQACFAGPIYAGYCNRVFWKPFGSTFPCQTAAIG